MQSCSTLYNAFKRQKVDKEQRFKGKKDEWLMASDKELEQCQRGYKEAQDLANTFRTTFGIQPTAMREGDPHAGTTGYRVYCKFEDTSFLFAERPRSFCASP